MRYFRDLLLLFMKVHSAVSALLRDRCASFALKATSVYASKQKRRMRHNYWDRAVPLALQSPGQKPRVRGAALDGHAIVQSGALLLRRKGDALDEIGNSGGRDRRLGGMLRFDYAAAAIRSDGFRDDSQEGLLGSQVAGREPRSLVFGLPSTAALVRAASPLKIS